MTETESIWKTYVKLRLRTCESRRVRLNDEIDSLHPGSARRKEATEERDRVLVEWGRLMTETIEPHLLFE
jgi:hypothetical protein